MTYTLSIAKDGELIVQLGITADEALAIVGRVIPKTAAASESVAKPKKQPGPKSKKLDSDMMHDAVRRHPATQQIEDMLVEGFTVPAILEKVEVSAPTVYVIKSRLRKEGRLPE